MAKVKMMLGTVVEIEKRTTPDGADGLRVRARLFDDKPSPVSNVPWAFPLLPKMFQTAPKEGEGVIVFLMDERSQDSQRFYIGPIISQPQYQKYCSKQDGTSLFKGSERKPLEKASKDDSTTGAFPSVDDVALVGRGSEDVILKYNDTTKTSEVDIRAGVRAEMLGTDKPSLVGNVIFNGVDPAYIQLKYKTAIASDYGHSANSLINMVANRINIMSNLDGSISHNLGDNETMVNESEIDNIMSSLHQVPKGDKLVELLNIMRECILRHVHGWPGKEQNGDSAGNIDKLIEYPIETILSDYVRIS